MHEAQLHEDNCFITLTYDDQHLPHTGTLIPRDLQLFMKRLRKAFPHKIRYYSCGEYGESSARPHYHACLFGHSFNDTLTYSNNRGIPLGISPTLSKLWPYGFSTVGAVTFESAAYVARYCTKKVTGKKADDHYWSTDPETGEMHPIAPEFARMSNRPGVGAGWYELYRDDVYPSDTVIVKGREQRPPRYYDTLFERTNPEELDEIKRKRLVAALTHKDNQTPERLAVRETVTRARIYKRDAI